MTNDGAEAKVDDVPANVSDLRSGNGDLQRPLKVECSFFSDD